MQILKCVITYKMEKQSFPLVVICSIDKYCQPSGNRGQLWPHGPADITVHPTCQEFFHSITDAVT